MRQLLNSCKLSVDARWFNRAKAFEPTTKQSNTLACAARPVRVGTFPEPAASASFRQVTLTVDISGSDLLDTDLVKSGIWDTPLAVTRPYVCAIANVNGA